MTWIDRLALFSPLDYGTVTILILSWAAIGWRIEHPGNGSPSVSSLMAEFRRLWMRQMVTREPRVFDAQVVSTLRQGTTFFASASMIALGGGLALVGDTSMLQGLANDLTLNDSPAFVWELKLVLILLFLANGFLKFVWSHRLFGYCSVLMAAVPNDPNFPTAYDRAAQAAEVCITAARSYNQGLRAIYFGLAASAWMLGPLVLLAATCVTVATLWRREFASKSRQILLALPAEADTQYTQT